MTDLEDVMSIGGPCHGLGQAAHRCSGAARWRVVRFAGLGGAGGVGGAEPWGDYRWCDGAAEQARAGGAEVRDA